MEILQKKLKLVLAYDLVIPLLGTYLKECKSAYNKVICTPMFISTHKFTITKLWNQPRCPSTDECIKSMLYTYTMRYYSPLKKNEIVLFFRKMDRTEHHILWK
jgi:hypothetical protein